MQGLQLMPGRPARSRRGLGDRRGAVAVIFAVSVVPLAMAVGLASDYSVYVKVQSQLNLAADTAAMQAVRVASEVSSTDSSGNPKSPSVYQADVQTAGQQAGQQWFQAQMGNLANGTVPAGNIAVSVGYTASPSRFTSSVRYTGTVPTSFGGLFHVANFGVTGASTAVISNAYVEVLMLLDNSSSMLIPSTAAGITRLEQATPCSTVGIDGNHQMYDWYTWNYSNGYSYPEVIYNNDGTSKLTYPSTTAPPASPVSGTCSAQYTGVSSSCPYPPTASNVDSSNTWYCKNKGGLPYTTTNSSGQSQTVYLAQAPCAFACHSSSSNNDFYYLAKTILSPPIELRLDVVQNAATNIITTLNSKQTVTNQFSVGVYVFNSSLSAVWPSSGEATTDLATAQSKTKSLTTPTANAGNTDFSNSMNSLAQNATNAGDGTTPAAPLKNLFIVTDGINDPNTFSNIGLMTSATNEQLCSLFWAKGFNVYVLYTPYLPSPSQKYQGQVIQYTEPTQTSPTAANVAALQACARYPSHFYTASDPAAINTAMQTMLAAALNSPGRVSN